MVRKQKMEQELEETLNERDTQVEERVDKTMELVDKIARITKGHEIFTTYLNNNQENN